MTLLCCRWWPIGPTAPFVLDGPCLRSVGADDVPNCYLVLCSPESQEFSLYDFISYLVVIEPPNYDGPQVHVIAIMTSDSRTYVHHNLKGLLFSEQDPIIGVL
jgi:hypothetical protein